uniref:helix-turn-helix domain-containing protein n=1 Tax=Ndongobacter massiliensis TaxID=1871025 RepID=UPI00092FF1C8|nr:helix-turn-helix transcriptional regulator [Ndongobacter massiliensis]
MTKITLKSARVNAHLTLREASEKIQKTQRTLSSWERGITAIPTQYFFKLCELYKMDPDYVDVPIVRDGFFCEKTTE